LNGTITVGVRITSVLAESGACFVGFNVSKRDHARMEPIPITISKAPATCFLVVRHVLRLDDEREHLTDARCAFGVYADDAKRKLLVRYDYNRDLESRASAHVHVDGVSPALTILSERTDARPELERLHLPVGGKRFRPCVEDVIEFLVTEGIARPHSRWSDVVDEHRAEYHRRQLRAAVRRDQESAALELRAQGWKLEPPTST